MKVLQPYIDKKELVVKSGPDPRLNKVTHPCAGDGHQGAETAWRDILTGSYKSGRVDAVLSPYDGHPPSASCPPLKVGRLRAPSSKPLPVITGQDAEPGPR